MEVLPLRLPPGVDLRSALEAHARDRQTSVFVVAGIGSLTQVNLRLAAEEVETKLDGPFELISLSGTLSKDGAHLHMVVADSRGSVLGGHVCYGNTIRTTAEVLLAGLGGWALAREYDMETGFKELVVRRTGEGEAPESAA